ncbi:MAG: hypothetical protein ABEK17_02920, partial [Candidatus Aenigmatarchaeota archaeon]
MKKVSFLIVIVVLIAGCTNFSGILAQLGVGAPKYTKTESISIHSEAIPSEVYSGESTRLYFNLENSGNTTLDNVNLEILDPCVFSPGGQNEFIGRLEPTEFEDWNWRVTANEVKMEKNCQILCRTTYESKAAALYDIAVISEEEYLRLKKEGTMEQDISINYYKTKSPLDIKMQISRKQPLMSGNEFYLDLQIVNDGIGETPRLTLPAGSLTIDYPNFLTFMGCNDFNSYGGGLSLSKNLKFFDGETKKMSCKFRVNRNVGIKEISQFEVNLRYKYKINKVINVKV